MVLGAIFILLTTSFSHQLFVPFQSTSQLEFSLQKDYDSSKSEFKQILHQKG
jgi:hypothetical protein